MIALPGNLWACDDIELSPISLREKKFVFRTTWQTLAISSVPKIRTDDDDDAEDQGHEDRGEELDQLQRGDPDLGVLVLLLLSFCSCLI